MKTFSLATVIGLLMLACTLTSCSRDSFDDLSTDTTQLISKGKWTVAYYFDGADKTALVQQYRLVFNANGTVAADDGINTFPGSWNLAHGVDRSDVLVMNFSCQELSGFNLRWNVNEKADTLLQLRNGASFQLRLRKG